MILTILVSISFFYVFPLRVFSQTTDPEDLSFIKKWAAIGDSYAAGIGAGNVVDKGCSRYDSSYPNLVNVQLGQDTSSIDFAFIACSGAKIPAIIDQANSLPGGQQMITISAGGNDASLIDALNDCVFTFKGLFGGNCDQTLSNIQTFVDSSTFASSIDGLITAAKSKLASGGTIYYAGYAQFFDASTNNCDGVSWHIWVNLFTKQYLTQGRRQKMNDLVIAVNSKIQAAVQRAGNQVVFIDYDAYVGFLGGRYCLPGVKEDKGQGANRDYLFFYEMKTSDTPWMQPNDDPYHDELRRRNAPMVASKDTLDGEIGSWIEDTINRSPNAQLNDDVANADLESSVASREHLKRNAPHSPSVEHRQHHNKMLAPRYRLHNRDSSWRANSTNFACASGTASGASACASGTGKSRVKSWNPTPSYKASVPAGSPSSILQYPTRSSLTTSPGLHPFGMSQSGSYPFSTYTSRESPSATSSSVPYSSGMYSSVGPSVRPMRSANSSSSRLPSTDGVHFSGDASPSRLYLTSSSGLIPTGTATAGVTGLGDFQVNGSTNFRPKEDSTIASYLVPDSVGRVFHPQQGGHALIANLIMYTMASRQAVSMGMQPPPQELKSIGSSCPMAPNPACSGSSSHTWFSRDAAISAISSFCQNYANLAGTAGKMTSATYNPNNLDYLSVSIAWDEDISLGENQCNNWFDIVVDACDTSTTTSKHGGSIGFAANASLSIDSLVMRRIWDGGKVSAHRCNGIDNNHYITQSTLASNIEDYCSASAAQHLVNSGSTFRKDYNAGTPDHVTLTTQWPSGPLSYQIFQEECTYYMSVVMNGCDVPSGSINPLNWKHGGSIADNNKVTYTITPNVDRAPPPNAALGNCKSWYKGFFATFDVYGGGWADSDYGQSPGGVLAQLRGCGVVTGWSFEYYDIPAKDGTEWHAWGKLPIGTRRCVGNAVKSSGGFDGGCGGNG